MRHLFRGRPALPLAGFAALVGVLAGAGCSSPAAPAGAAGTPTSTVTAPATGTPSPTANKTTSAPPPAGSDWPSPEDCISYDPNSVTVQFDGAIYTVSDGSQVVMRLHGQTGDQVGQQALALAQRFRRHCYIGRANTRIEDRGAYIFDYWRSTSGRTPTIPGLEDICSDYNRNNLTVEDMGDGNGWRVKDHDHVLQLFDNGTDARNGKLVLAKYHQICTIGDPDDDQDVVSFMQ
jgi:hypothetical protein